MAIYEVELDWQTPEQKRLVQELRRYGLWGEEEANRKAPHTIHYMEYEVKVPLTKKEAEDLKAHLKKTYEGGGYVIRDIKIKHQIA